MLAGGAQVKTILQQAYGSRGAAAAQLAANEGVGRVCAHVWCARDVASDGYRPVIIRVGDAEWHAVLAPTQAVDVMPDGAPHRLHMECLKVGQTGASIHASLHRNLGLGLEWWASARQATCSPLYARTWS